MITRTGLCANCPGSDAVAAVISRLLLTPRDNFYEIASDITAWDPHLRKYAASASLCQHHLFAIDLALKLALCTVGARYLAVRGYSSFL